MYWIYCIENKVNGKKYIGKATKPKRRWASHLSISRNHSKHQKYIHRAIAKYGIDNFWFRCIGYEMSETQALEQEKEYIKLFNTTDPKIGYNLTMGGEGKSGYKHTIETKKLLSKLSKQRLGKSNSFYGRTHSDNTKDKIRSARIKLTATQVNYLIDSYKKDNIPVSFLANELRISKSHAYALINGEYKR